MWRFIIMTFAFLGWSFYTLSGGADYQPIEGSRQAEARTNEALKELAAVVDKATEPNSALPEPRETDSVSRNQVDLTEISPALLQLDKPLPVALKADDPVTPETTDIRVANLSLSKPAAFAQAAGYAPASVDARPQIELRDLRQITGTSVNMRTGPGTRYGILTRVTRGTEVEVLESFENGWLRLRVLDSSRIGWVSTKLVSDPQG
jgi:hypothetical protein